MKGPIIVQSELQRQTLLLLLAGNTVADIAAQRHVTRDAIHGQIVRARDVNDLGSTEQLLQIAAAHGVEVRRSVRRAGGAKSDSYISKPQNSPRALRSGRLRQAEADKRARLRAEITAVPSRLGVAQ